MRSDRKADGNATRRSGHYFYARVAATPHSPRLSINPVSWSLSGFVGPAVKAGAAIFTGRGLTRKTCQVYQVYL